MTTCTRSSMPTCWSSRERWMRRWGGGGAGEQEKLALGTSLMLIKCFLSVWIGSVGPLCAGDAVRHGQDCFPRLSHCGIHDGTTCLPHIHTYKHANAHAHICTVMHTCTHTGTPQQVGEADLLLQNCAGNKQSLMGGEGGWVGGLIEHQLRGHVIVM